MYKILFVDDEPAIGFIVSRFRCWQESEFTLGGFVQSGQEALEELKRENYDLVVTDIRMPVMDGIELLSEIRRCNLRTSVVLCSTYNDFQYAREGMRLGALDYISKPLTEQKLTEELLFVEDLIRQQKNEKEHQLDVMANISSARQSQMVEALLSQKEEAKQMLSDIVQEVEASYAEDNKKIASILELLFVSLWKQILEKYSWLGCFADFETTIRPENYPQDVDRCIHYIQETVEKFQIAHYDHVINSMCDIIVDNLQNDNVIDIISTKLELSPDYIRVLFKNKTGINFSRFMTLLKMEYAKKLLKETNDKIYEISEKCGYTTIDYFTKLFKNYTGYTPMQFRKII